MMMKKMSLRIVAAVLSVFLMLMPAASADMVRGDRGEDVRQLQQMLFESGWLFELPDGVFGRNTEQAVKDFEAYANLTVDGIADDQMVYELTAAWEILMGHNGADGENGERIKPLEYPACCIAVRQEDGTSYMKHCEAHQAMSMTAQSMLDSNDAEEIQQATMSLQWETENLYDRWISLLPEEEKGAATANKAMFFANIDAQRRAGSSGAQTIEKRRQTEIGVMKSLITQVEWLCGLLWELENLNDNADAPIMLSRSTIIDGDKIYYSGSVDGIGAGVYVMNADGTEVRQLTEVEIDLLAVSGGNLLGHWYDWELNEDVTVLIKKDGTIVRLNDYSNGYAITDNGRFYWGAYSMAADGSDLKTVIPCSAEDVLSYYPLTVVDGYLYYMDNVGCEGVFYESIMIPPSAALCRISLADGHIDRISGNGTRFIGIEDGVAYYTRQNFYMIDEKGDFIEHEVDQALYHMNLEVLAETQLTELATGDQVYDDYRLLKNGVIYGERTDYTNDTDGWGEMVILRMTAGGTLLESIDINSECGMTTLCVVNGVHYSAYVQYIDSDYTNGMDCIFMYNLKDGSWTEIGLDNNATMFWGEFNPSIAVVDGRIYYEAMDNDSYTVALRMLNIEDGVDIVLAKGMDY